MTSSIKRAAPFVTGFLDSRTLAAGADLSMLLASSTYTLDLPLQKDSRNAAPTGMVLQVKLLVNIHPVAPRRHGGRPGTMNQ